MNKKMILAVILFVLLLSGVPLVQLLFFSNHPKGGDFIDRPLEAPYLQSAKKDLTLVFFGYVGCVNICTPVLNQLDDFYDSDAFAALKPSVGFSFVNLMPEVKPDQPNAFAHSFNPDFEGVYLTPKELARIDGEFNLFFSKTLNDPNELNHSDHLYLIQRHKNGNLLLKNIYSTHPLDRQRIIADVTRSLKEMP